MQRLGVHCSLEGRNETAMVDAILGVWLRRYGRGRELFDSSGPVESSAPAAITDRLTPSAEISPDGEIAA